MAKTGTASLQLALLEAPSLKKKEESLYQVAREAGDKLVKIVKKAKSK